MKKIIIEDNWGSGGQRLTLSDVEKDCEHVKQQLNLTLGEFEIDDDEEETEIIEDITIRLKTRDLVELRDFINNALECDYKKVTKAEFEEYQELKKIFEDIKPRLIKEITTAGMPHEQQVSVSEISDLVDKFLAWELPKSVCSDKCVTDNNYPHPRCGTNLLTADEAKQMLEYLFNTTK